MTETGVLTTKERLMRIETKIDFFIDGLGKSNKELEKVQTNVASLRTLSERHSLYFKLIWTALGIIGTVTLTWLGPVATQVVTRIFGGG